ncbi:MAG: hypothetical protein EXS18_02000 [Verrucomicrobiae bacterium]|nr:hypothetical protein [Verrucomicrobiae bacterium]
MLKVAALLLAIIIWSMINDAISSTPASASLPEEIKVLKDVPVLVLGRASIAGDIVLRPSFVNVTVKGLPEQVRHLVPSQITLYVDVSNIGNKDRYRQRVLSSINASGVQIGSISPPTVEVELR